MKNVFGVGSFAKAGWKLWRSWNWLLVSRNELTAAGYLPFVTPRSLPSASGRNYKLTGEKLELFIFGRDAAR